MPSVTLADDLYHDLATLLGMPRDAAIKEGFLSAVTNGMTWRYGDATTPATAADGTPVGVGGSVGFGPARDASAAWSLGRLWVRNTTAGSNATIVLNVV